MLPPGLEARPRTPVGALSASVVVPVRDAERTLRPCLQAILASERLGPFEVIVVDDGSSDATAEVAASLPCRLIRCEQGRGPAAARNRGAHEARAPRLVFVDADVVVRPDSLARLVSALDGAPAAFGSYDPRPLNQNFATLLYHALSCQSIRDTAARTPVFYSYCAAIRRDLFLALGGFDARFTRATFEDVELGCRLAEQGRWSAHLSDVQVVHAVHYTLRGLARAYYRKSHDLARLLLSRGALSLDDQGWTRRRHWAVLASAWGTLGLAPLVLWADPLWTLPWGLATSFFVGACGDLASSLARHQRLYGPLAVLAYLGIHYIATLAMLSALGTWIGDGCRRHLSRPPRGRPAVDPRAG